MMKNFFVLSPIKKHSLRFISNVIPKNSLTDFSVRNEPVLSYLPGSSERKQLEVSLERCKNSTAEVPIIIGGKEFRSDQVRYQVMPHDHRKKIAKFYYATPEMIQLSIQSSLEAKKEWDSITLQERINLFQRVANLMATTYRGDLNASTMLGQSKTLIQAEIDAACELVDFLRFNSYFSKELSIYQPISEDPKTTLNSLRFRALEGFVASISPFNFTAIAGNLAFSPALMGNGVVWKPSDTSILSNYWIYKIFEEAGFPKGLVNFVPSDGPIFGSVVTSHKDLSAINFTGSVPTFRWLWKSVGNNLEKYSGFPKLIGECGGKNYHFVHPSADVETVVTSTIRSAFEYQGQKCSACSRMYVPQSLWPKIKEGLIQVQSTLKVGDVCEFDSFMSAVIDKKAFNRIVGYIERAKNNSNQNRILCGGTYNDSNGYFIQPTIIETLSTSDPLLREEIFGPLLSVYVYNENEMLDVLSSVATDSSYALTGAIYSQDEEFAQKATEILKYSAGNFYVNDKSTGSVVGQQPFGGAKLSGTNDKAGGPHYMLKWTSPQSIKQTFISLSDVGYPYMKSI